LSAELSTQIEAALADYEALRAAFAADRIPDSGEIAARLEASANAAKEGAATDAALASVATRLGEVATAAAGLKSGGDADAQRSAFGELSRAVVSLLSENTALTQGRHVFQCPMAQGYQKWVQLGEQVENPYMGSRMLGCGLASEWRP
jgi:hypothetical protein